MDKPIWHTQPTVEQLNELRENTIAQFLDIQFIEIGPDYLRGTMPAGPRTFQPLGLIHGGANVVLAETIGSVGANLLLDTSQYYALGQEVNANHLRGVSAGLVTGTARPIHRGRSSQVWEIRIEDERGKLTCISRLTMAVLKHA